MRLEKATGLIFEVKCRKVFYFFKEDQSWLLNYSHEDYQNTSFWSVVGKFHGNLFFFNFSVFLGIWSGEWRVTEKPFSVLKSNDSVYSMYIVSPVFQQAGRIKTTECVEFKCKMRSWICIHLEKLEKEKLFLK